MSHLKPYNKNKNLQTKLLVDAVDILSKMCSQKYALEICLMTIYYGKFPLKLSS